MTWTSFPGNRVERRLSRGFSLLPTMVVLLSISAFMCSLLAARRGSVRLLERERAAFECALDAENARAEEGWCDVAF